MSKLVHVTLMLELVDDADPEDLDWPTAIIEHMPMVTGFSLVDLELRPYASMEDDPSSHTQH